MKTDFIIAGDTLDFTTSAPDYPASAGWSLVFKLIPRTSGSVITITSTASGDDHQCQVGASTTAAWAAGNYSWSSRVTNGTEQYSLEQGSIVIKPDPATATTLDNRSHARKMLENIEAWLESRDPAVAEYEIAGRKMKYTPPDVLYLLKSRLTAEVAAEDNAARLANGLGTGRKIQFRI